ncbi:MAG: 3-hydroxyacyl-ACP dehydratase FabZ [Treponema sp.]|jgi:3-hydroxyacyl-[acyl-carrier-protein] dehydratase|nr:3-hydroxyacyl-ACP dehydratase FabZ [Treponema sp.]
MSGREKQNEIEALLPHRDPFLFVDGIVSADTGKIVARHVFTEKDFFFQGHFPQYPVTPGVILLETLAQSGGAGLRKLGLLGGDALFFLASIDKVRFRRRVLPGEEVRSEIRNLRVSARTIRQAGKAYVGDELAAEAEWLCVVSDPQPAPPPDPR